jgi:type I restriction enzyme S subunit
VIERNNFAYCGVTSRNGEKITIALFNDYDKALISQAYTPFKITDTDKLLPEYLMMWFSREEFDREAAYYAVGGVRGNLPWDDFLEMQIPIPPISRQREIVAQYNAIQNRINQNNALIARLEQTAQAIYKEWFVDGVDRENLPEGWRMGTIGDYATVKSGYAFKSDWWLDSGIPVIKIGSISNNSINVEALDFVHSEKMQFAMNYIVKEGDIVIAMTGATIGKIGLVSKFHKSYLVNQRVGMFNLGLNPIRKAPFLFFTLLTDEVQNEIVSVGGDSAQENISNTQIENISIVIPDVNTLNRYNDLCRVLLHNILNKQQESQKLEQLKILLLSRMASIEKNSTFAVENSRVFTGINTNIESI